MASNAGRYSITGDIPERRYDTKSAHICDARYSIMQPAHCHSCRSRHDYSHSHRDSPRYYHLHATPDRVRHHLNARHDIHRRDFPCHIHRYNHRRPPPSQHREQTRLHLHPGKDSGKAESHLQDKRNTRDGRSTETLYTPMGLVGSRLCRSHNSIDYCKHLFSGKTLNKPSSLLEISFR